jgi:NAD(P)H-hydrate epimerase
MSNLILTSQEVQALEKRAFAEGVSQEALMDSAGLGIGRKIAQLEPLPGICLVYLGRGNNAGDAIVAASVLERSGWSIGARLVGSPEDFDFLPKKKWNDLATHFRQMPSASIEGRDGRQIILLDGLLGLGARPGLSDRYRQLTTEMNRVRNDWNAKTFAVDIPTGLTDSGVDPDSVVADVTLTVGFPKSCLFLDEATNVVGTILVIDLPPLTERAPTDSSRNRLTDAHALYHLVKRRPFDSHKGDFGRIGIIAGSRGFIGAGVLASQAVLKAGAGLVTLYATEDIYSIVASKAEFANPMVVDADALNIISERPEILSHLAGPRLLTPHPGEMSRLFHTNNLSRAEIVQRFTNEYPVTLLLKGARTLIGQRGYPLSYNSTGTPGMATGGSGDLLTGACGALIGRRIAPYDAARLGAWLCGRAAELTLRDQSEESMIPTDTLRFFGKAFEEIREARGRS